VGSGFKPIAMEQQLAGDGQVTVMQAVPAGAGGQQVQVMSLSKSLFLSRLYWLRIHDITVQYIWCCTHQHQVSCSVQPNKLY